MYISFLIELKLSSQRVNLNITHVNFLLGPKIPTPQGAAIKDAKRRDIHNGTTL